MKTRDTEYLYATMRVRSLERSLLDATAIERLIDAPSLDDMAKVLLEHNYKELQNPTGAEIEKSLHLARRETIALLAEISPNPALCDVFRLRYDYHNVKAILKGDAAGQNPESLLIDAGRYSITALIAAIRQMDYRELSPTLREATEQARETLARTGDAQICDFVLDRAYFKEMVQIANQSDSKFLKGYVALMIDATNLRTALRAARQNKDTEFLRRALFAGGNVSAERILQTITGEIKLTDIFVGTLLENAANAAAMSGSLTQFEKLCDDALITYLKSARYVAFGEAPIVAFIAAREADIMTIRIITAGKIQGLSADEIRERLRESYV